MKIRSIVAGLMIGATAFLAGCPLDDGLALGFFEPISDGTYQGSVTAIAEFWNNGVPVDQSSGSISGGATFVDGAVLGDDGYALEIGDWEELELDSMWISREIWNIEYGEAAYQISYDVYAESGPIPMEGTEFITFSGNADGSLTYFDTLELTSLDDYDGGAWTVHVNTSGTLGQAVSPTPPSNPSPLSNPDPLSNPILDRKSGKTKH